MAEREYSDNGTTVRIEEKAKPPMTARELTTLVKLLDKYVDLQRHLSEGCAAQVAALVKVWAHSDLEDMKP